MKNILYMTPLQKLMNLQTMRYIWCISKHMYHIYSVVFWTQNLIAVEPYIVSGHFSSPEFREPGGNHTGE